MTLASAPTQNNLLISAIFTRDDNGPTNPSGWITDISVVNTAELDTLRIAHKVAGPSESATITWTQSSGVDANACGVIEVSGVDTASPLDKTASTGRTTNATSLSSGTTAALSQANELSFAAFGIRSTVTSPAMNNSYTLLHNVAGDSGSVAATLLDGYKIVSDGSAQSTTASWTGSVTAMGAIATFKAAGGPSVPAAMLNAPQQY